MFLQNYLKSLQSVKMSTGEYIKLKFQNNLIKYKLTDFEKKKSINAIKLRGENGQAKGWQT